MQLADFVSRLPEFLSDLEAEGPWPLLKAGHGGLHAAGPCFTSVLGFSKNLKSLSLGLP